MNKIRGGIYGVAVGDALGSTLEFVDKSQIEKQYGELTDIIGGGWLNIEPGEWTDDTEMTLAVAMGLIANPNEPIPHIGKMFLEWASTNPPDIGITIRTVFKKMSADTKNWHDAAEAVHNEGMRTAGNGALMRTLPIALLYKDPADIYMFSMQVARMTHWDPEAGLTCFLYCLLVREFLNGATDKQKSLEVARKIFLKLTPHQFTIEAIKLIDHLSDINKWTRDDLMPSGYTVDSLSCALWSFFNNETFEDAIIAAVNLGGDADTIGAITGGLAGVYWGYEAIAKRWIDKFSPSQKEKLDKTSKRLGSIIVYPQKKGTE